MIVEFKVSSQGLTSNWFEVLVPGRRGWKNVRLMSVSGQDEIDMVCIENMTFFCVSLTVLFSDICDSGSFYQNLTSRHLLHKMFFISMKCSVYLCVSQYILKI